MVVEAPRANEALIFSPDPNFPDEPGLWRLQPLDPDLDVFVARDGDTADWYLDFDLKSVGPQGANPGETKHTANILMIAAQQCELLNAGGAPDKVAQYGFKAAASLEEVPC
jgi:hypothetical protein